MKRPLVVLFLAVAFVIYWLNAFNLPGEDMFSLGTITPTITRIVEAEPTPRAHTTADFTETKPATVSGSNLQAWLHDEAQLIGQIDPHPQQTMARLRQRAARLGTGDLALLKRISLDLSASRDKRFLAVYLLALAPGRDAVERLKEVGMTAIAATSTDRQHSEEVILRAQAVEALVKRLTPREARSWLQEILSQTADPILARQAQYWLTQLG